MRRTILLITALPLVSSLFAQPQLVSSALPPIGTVTTYDVVNNLSVIDTTLQGANVTWDFSGITSSGDPVVFTFLDPSATPQGADFPTANYARHGTNDSYIDYFHKTDSYLDLVGFWNQGGGAVTYTDPQRDMVFPMTLGTTNSDTWANTLSSFGGTYSLEGVGYGTLALPSGTYQNVVMVRAIQNELLAFPIYTWYSTENGVMLLNYIVGDGLFYQVLGWSITEISIDVQEHDVVSDLRFVAPVIDILDLTFTSDMTGSFDYVITNSLGQRIRTDVIAATTGTQRNQLFVGDLNNGVYLLTLSPRDARGMARTIRFVKQ